jgi:hypothetical protein
MGDRWGFEIRGLAHAVEVAVNRERQKTQKLEVALHRARERLRVLAGQLSRRKRNAASLPTGLAWLHGRVQEFPTELLGSGVYLLIENDRVVYVGRSLCLADRITTHLRRQSFDRVLFIPVSDRIEDVESALIFKLNPSRNLARPKVNADAVLKDAQVVVGLAGG